MSRPKKPRASKTEWPIQPQHLSCPACYGIRQKIRAVQAAELALAEVDPKCSCHGNPMSVCKTVRWLTGGGRQAAETAQAALDKAKSELSAALAELAQGDPLEDLT